jgi:erythromycin esterase
MPIRRISSGRTAVGLCLSLAMLACSSGDTLTPLEQTPPPPPPPAPSGPVAVLVPGVPAPWSGSWSAPNTFEVGVDRGIRRNGNASAYIRAVAGLDSATAFGFLTQRFSAAPFRGRRVRLSGYVKADGINGAGAGLWLRVDGPTGPLRFDNMIDYGRGIVGTRDWTPYTVVLDVPVNAVSIIAGMLMSATGTVRVDDLAFGPVDTSVPTTGTDQPGVQSADSVTSTNIAARQPLAPGNLDFEGMPPLATSAAPWLLSVARPFTTDAPGSPFDDLAELGTIIGNARVAAFGEATHGTAEFFRMKHRAFEYLVERHGFTHFTIEATMPESRAVDRFVTHGEGYASQLLRNLYFWTWNTQEVLDLIRWMRAYNVRVGAPRLRFVGFDMGSPQLAIDSVRVQLARLDTELGSRARRAVECVAGGRNATSGTYLAESYRANTTSAQRIACADSLAALGIAVAAARPQWIGRASADDLDWLQQYVTLVQQWERTAANVSTSFLRREEAMAENLLWITQRNPTARVFAWAHNGHVSRRPGGMGQVLGQRLGAAYRNVGFTFGTGEFNAVEKTATGAFTTLRAHRISEIDPTAIESVFAATRQPRLIFDARRLASGDSGAATLAGQPLRMRSIGGAYGSSFADGFFESARLPADYDGLIWFASTSASVLLPF